MPFNGSGVYSAPSLPGSFNPAIAGQDATPADWNTLLADLSSALSQTITSNGESTITQDIPMNSHKFTGVSNATARTQFPSMGQIQDGGGVYAADAGTANAMAITLSPALTTYAVGQRFRIKKSSSANTTAVTLNINSIGAGDVKWPDGTALGAGALPANAMFDVEVQDISTPTAPVFHLQTVASPPINSGGTVTGTLTMSGAAINEAVRVDVASATTTDIGAAASNYVRITGTTTITGLGTIASGVRRKVVFAGVLTLTHNATSLILPTGANITTAAGDCAEFESEGSGNWRCTDYMRASGAAVMPLQQYAQAYCTVSGGVLTTQKQTGFTSIVRDAQGLLTCTLSTAMPDTNYVVEFTCGSTSGITLNRYCGEDLSTARSTTVFHLYVNGDNAGQQDPANLNIRVYA